MLQSMMVRFLSDSHINQLEGPTMLIAHFRYYLSFATIAPKPTTPFSSRDTWQWKSPLPCRSQAKHLELYCCYSPLCTHPERSRMLLPWLSECE
ncbi:hypothetical protein U1Q18_052365 [Sarracenia purpurea var. burkii]